MLSSVVCLYGPHPSHFVPNLSLYLYRYSTITLALFAAGRVSTYDFPKVRPRPANPQFAKEAIKDGIAPLYLVRNHAKVCELLTGMRRMPGGKMPINMPGSGSLLQAAIYATTSRDLCEKTPGALEYLRKLVNTQTLGDIMSKRSVETNRETDIAPILNLIDDGIFPNALHVGEMATHEPLLHMAIFQRSNAHIIIDKLLAAGADEKVTVTQGLNALHKACYYACGRPVIRSLVAAGLSPLQRSPPGAGLRRPLLMAAEQGNWEELEECLNLLPKGNSSDLHKSILDVMMTSSCIECVGGGPKCGRCEHGDRKHGPNVSYKKIVDVIVDRGFRLYDTEALREFIGKRPGPYDDLVRYQYEKFKNLSKMVGVPGCGFVGCNNGNNAESFQLKKCVRCQSVRYCSKECQAVDWKLHKKVCKPAK